MAYNKQHKPQNNITYNNTYNRKSHNITKENYTTYNKTKTKKHIFIQKNITYNNKKQYNI